jgi:hypothetical protein
MKKNLKSISQAIIIAAFTLVVFAFGNSMAWTGPSGSAPSGNIPAPINTGSSIQEKIGALIINSSTSTPASSGLFAFGDSTFYGKILSAEDICIPELGSGETSVYNQPGALDNFINNPTQSVNCLTKVANYAIRSYIALANQTETSQCTESVSTNPTPLSQSLAIYRSIDLPDYCRNGNICSIFQTITDTSGNAVRHRVINFSQYNSGLWWSSDNTDGALINGDSSSNNIATDFNTATVLIRDDRTGTENSDQTITLIDTSSTRNMIVKICNDATMLDDTKAILDPAIAPAADPGFVLPAACVDLNHYFQTFGSCNPCPTNYQRNTISGGCTYCPSPSVMVGGSCQVRL